CRWNTTVVRVIGSLGVPVRRSSHLFMYIDTAIGLGIGRTRFDDQNDDTTTKTYFGWAFDVESGLGKSHLFGNRSLTMTVGMRAGIARGIEDGIGDSQEAMGAYLITALHYIP